MTKHEIIQKLKATLQHSYSTYSNVQVAAAIEYELDGKSVFEFGVNVENASYGLTNCAERTAIYAAVTKGMRGIKRVYIISNLAEPIMPCGACRQVLMEFSQADTPVTCFSADGERDIALTMGELLPHHFSL
ncbi:cytidine deaminase [Bowmanella sp. JS7-9]|uniref:Cytidine deaminase n=1 Tax=Pseudobowmanella zhangzhouensis TaxID=1537679 RepID=A0ABW1XIQ6_9ALTE|nr:cytidine deaminase [Bowmanella sp. JS7-9]